MLVCGPKDNQLTGIQSICGSTFIAPRLNFEFEFLGRRKLLLVSSRATIITSRYTWYSITIASDVPPVVTKVHFNTACIQLGHTIVGMLLMHCYFDRTYIIY